MAVLIKFYLVSDVKPESLSEAYGNCDSSPAGNCNGQDANVSESSRACHALLACPPAEQSESSRGPRRRMGIAEEGNGRVGPLHKLAHFSNRICDECRKRITGSSLALCFPRFDPVREENRKAEESLFYSKVDG